MKVDRPVFARLFIATLLVVAAAAAKAEEPLPNNSALTIKGGAFRLAEDSQNIGNQTWKFGGPYWRFAFEGEGWIDVEKHVSIGGEFMRFSGDFRLANDPNINHMMEAIIVTARCKYFFGSRDDAWRPYLGAGIGIADALDGHGPLHGDATGLALQGIAGMQVRGKRVGFRMEYTYIAANVGDGEGRYVDISGHRLFAGLSFFFGSAR